jgi:hypothetical protein
MISDLEKVLMSFHKEEMIRYVANHPESFEELVQLAMVDKQPYSWRAAWLLWSCMEENDSRVKGHIRTIIGSLKGKNDGHQRELLKILYQMEIDEKYEGLVFDHCVSIWEKINKKPSVRFNAFKFIIKISRKYPELSREISFLTQDHYMDTLSNGVKRSLIKMINGIDEAPVRLRQTKY